jgi:multidrug efflux pump subunit AcrA (membrane-fusion protein)
MSKLNQRPLLNIALGLLCIAAVVVAYTTVGEASQSSTQSTRTATVREGVVQSTVSGSGNIRAASQLNLGFKTSGTVTHIYVTEAEHVSKGKLLATLDPQAAEVTLAQAKAGLQSAEASLAAEQESGGETSSGQGSTASGTSSQASTAAVTSSGSSSPSSGASSSGSTVSAATREANLASARAAVKSDKLTVQSDEQAVQNTKLYAPQDGTIVSLSGEVGETVSATGTTKASSASSSSSSSSSTGATGSSSPSSSTGSSSSSASSSSSSFAVLSNLSSMQLVVPLSESEIGNVKVGQTATVTLEALSGRKVAAHVLSVDALSTSNSGVVSYNVTFQLDQMESGVKVGMSASAEVVVKQAEGLNVPSTAISGGSVTVVRGGKHVSQAVATGLVGDSSTIILSGLKAGDEIVLPSVTSTTTSSSSKAGSARVGGLGGLGGGLGGGGAFRGGGPPGG